MSKGQDKNAYFPIIDTHLHIWDMDRLNYSAFEGHPIFGRSYP